jgi:heat shock protein HslJ
MSGTIRTAGQGILLLGCLVISACSTEATRQAQPGSNKENTPTPVRLAGTEWVLEDLAGTGVVDDARATLAFPEDYVATERVGGSGSCNRFMGTAKVAAGLIEVGPLATTQMACVPAVMDQESRYLKALQAAERCVFDGPYLLVYSKGMAKPLRFIRKSGG